MITCHHTCVQDTLGENTTDYVKPISIVMPINPGLSFIKTNMHRGISLSKHGLTEAALLVTPMTSKGAAGSTYWEAKIPCFTFTSTSFDFEHLFVGKKSNNTII